MIRKLRTYIYIFSVALKEELKIKLGPLYLGPNVFPCLPARSSGYCTVVSYQFLIGLCGGGGGSSSDLRGGEPAPHPF